MISYVIASNKEPEILKPTFESISGLAQHHYEIVICAPYAKPEWVTDPRIKYVFDEINDGSTYGMNMAARHARGEWLLVGTDEHLVSYNVNNFLDVINSPQIQNQEFQVINMGGLWVDNLRKQIVSFPPVDCTNIPPDVQGYQYPVVFFPAVSRKTIDTKFDGELFNPHLIHHYVDHWMGFYVSFHEPNHDFGFRRHTYLSHTNTAWNSFRSTWPSQKWDNHDANKFCNLAAIMIQKQNKVGYTSNL
jgi:hypothetical protein